MWCRTCRQDVPGIYPSATTPSRMCCPRCGPGPAARELATGIDAHRPDGRRFAVVGRDQSTRLPLNSLDTALGAPSPRVRFDDSLRSPWNYRSAAFASDEADRESIPDAPRHDDTAIPPRGIRRFTKGHALPAAVLTSSGVVAVVLGAVLVTCSLLSSPVLYRLWPIGLGVTLLGHVVLACGLALCIECGRSATGRDRSDHDREPRQNSSGLRTATTATRLDALCTFRRDLDRLGQGLGERRVEGS